MRLDIVIPTFMREARLKRCVDHVKHARCKAIGGDVAEITCYIWVSLPEEYELYQSWYPAYDWVKVVLLDNRYVEAPRDWDIHMRTTTANWVHFLMDDQYVQRDCYKKVFGTIREKCPTGDGVIGIRVDDRPDERDDPKKNDGSIVIGAEFCRKRFGEHPIFCPDYMRWGFDVEFANYSKYVKRLYCSMGARIDHEHPAVTPGIKPDECFKRGRNLIMPLDMEVMQKRKKAGYVWGRTFKRLETVTWPSE